MYGSAVGRGRAGRPDHDQQHCYHHAPTVKPEAATAVVELLMMGVRTPETCWAVLKPQVINLENSCIWLVDLLELMKQTLWKIPQSILYIHLVNPRRFSHKITLKTKNNIQGSSWQEIFLISAVLLLKPSGGCSQSETLLISSLCHYPPGVFSRKTPNMSWNVPFHILNLRLLMSYIYIWSTYSWCF